MLLQSGVYMLQLDQNSSAISAADRLLVEQEHFRLEAFLHDLRGTCSKLGAALDCGCDKEQMACCQGRVASFYYDFLDLAATHFDNEENIMRASLPAADDDVYFQSHQQAHARLLREVQASMRQALALSKQGKTAAAIQLLYRQISAMFGEHGHAYDAVLLRIT